MGRSMPSTAVSSRWWRRCVTADFRVHPAPDPLVRYIEKEKIAFLFLGVFRLPLAGRRLRHPRVPEELVQTALTLGASKSQVIRSVLVPAALPEICDSFRVMTRISWTYVILAEAVNPEHGLGYMVEWRERTRGLMVVQGAGRHRGIGF